MLLDERELVVGGGLLVGAGRVHGVVRSRRALARARAELTGRAVELGDLLIAPGLIDAHAHLELGALAGRVSAAGRFRDWIERVIAARRGLVDAELEAGAAAGAAHLLRTGTTMVGDIDSTGIAVAVLARHPLRARVFREVLDGADPARADAALAAVRRALPRRESVLEGLSPHAPYSVSRELLQRAAELARRRRIPVSIHWSETEDELAWMAGEGDAFDGLCRPAPGPTALDRIERAGLLSSATSLVHGNHPLAGEARRIAAAGVTLIHCPGSHQYFDRPPFPLSHYRERGVSIALGTDSLASNADLDMRREMALLRTSAPSLAPEAVWSMATTGGARALGLEGQVGRLQPGQRADFCAFEAAGETVRECLEVLTSGLAEVDRAWIGGRRAASVHFRDGLT